MIVFNTRARLPVWADPPTQDALVARFGYAFVQPAGSPYPPILDLHTIRGAFEVPGPGGPLSLTPLRADHGSMDALGFRCGPLAYLPDAVAIPDETWPRLAGLECWIVDALRRRPHPTHAHLGLTLQWIARAAPARAVLTNMHIDLDYAALAAEVPAHVAPAWDGMVLEFPL